MANEQDYEGIERPYNSFLERTTSEDVVLGSNGMSSSDSVGATSPSGSSLAGGAPSYNGSPAAAPVTGATAQQGNQSITSGDAFSDIYLATWIKSQNYQPKVQGFIIDARRGYIECMQLYVGGGGIVGGSLDIPNITDVASWHVDSQGNMWSGATTFAGAPFSVSNTGALVASSATVAGALTTNAGSSLNGTYLNANTVASASLNIAARGWTQTCTFSSPSAAQVNWSSGTFTASDGTAYSISAGNTGTISSRTYIYLDTAISTTTYQVTTSPGTAVGNGKVLIATALNGTTEATYQAFGGVGGLNIDAASIVADSITANEIQAGAITAAKINVSQLSAISANLGAITAGTVTLDTSGYIRGGQTDYNTGTGFFLGYSGSAYKFSIGDGTVDNSLTWDGSILTVNGSGVTNNDIFGSGEDGNVTISSNTSLTQDKFYNNLTINGGFTLNPSGYRIFVKNTLTINSTGKIAWNGNNATNGQNITGQNPTGGTGGSGGAALTTTSLAGSVAGRAGGGGGTSPSSNAGGAGGSGSNGDAGLSVTHSFATSFTSTSANGGAGAAAERNGNPTFHAGGAAGSAGAAGVLTSASVIRPYCAQFGTQMFDLAPGATASAITYNAGCGGAGGGGAGAESFRSGLGASFGGGGGGGGGSGSGGGTIVLAARTIINNGSIEAVGGNGGNGGSAGNGRNGDRDGAIVDPNGLAGGGGGGGGGGGAGGPGGVIILIYSSLSGAGTTSVAAGASGTGGARGTGGDTGGLATATAGADGTAGSTAATAASGKIVTLIV